MLARWRVSSCFMRTCEAGTERTASAKSSEAAPDARSADGLMPGRSVLQIVLMRTSEAGTEQETGTAANHMFTLQENISLIGVDL